MCDGIQDCVGGTDEVNCGISKTIIAVTGRMLVMYCFVFLYSSL